MKGHVVFEYEDEMDTIKGRTEYSGQPVAPEKTVLFTTNDLWRTLISKIQTPPPTLGWSFTDSST